MIRSFIGHLKAGGKSHRWVSWDDAKQPKVYDLMLSRCGLVKRLAAIHEPTYPQTVATCIKCNYAGYRPRAVHVEGSDK